VTLIDGKRFIFVPAEFRRVLLKKLASAFKRSRQRAT
jgi:DNA-binding transcriptional regulator/RsmH inhibitor MraZ